MKTYRSGRYRNRFLQASRSFLYPHNSQNKTLVEALLRAQSHHVIFVQTKNKSVFFIKMWDSRHLQQSTYTAFEEESDFQIKNKQILEPGARSQKIRKTYISKFFLSRGEVILPSTVSLISLPCLSYSHSRHLCWHPSCRRRWHRPPYDPPYDPSYDPSSCPCGPRATAGQEKMRKKQRKYDC